MWKLIFSSSSRTHIHLHVGNPFCYSVYVNSQTAMMTFWLLYRKIIYADYPLSPLCNLFSVGLLDLYQFTLALLRLSPEGDCSKSNNLMFGRDHNYFLQPGDQMHDWPLMIFLWPSFYGALKSALESGYTGQLFKKVWTHCIEKVEWE